MLRILPFLVHYRMITSFTIHPLISFYTLFIGCSIVIAFVLNIALCNLLLYFLDKNVFNYNFLNEGHIVRSF